MQYVKLWKVLINISPASTTLFQTMIMLLHFTQIFYLENSLKSACKIEKQKLIILFQLHLISNVLFNFIVHYFGKKKLRT